MDPAALLPTHPEIHRSNPVPVQLRNAPHTQININPNFFPTMPCIDIDDKLWEALQREAKRRGEDPRQTLKRILELYFGYGEEEEKEIIRRLRDLGYA